MRSTITFALLLLWSWLVMTVTHELGHLAGGLLGGARLDQIELRPWHLPHSLWRDDAHRLVTLWAGPLLGCTAPLIAAAMVRRDSFWLVAWFCVLSNGVYLLLGYYSGEPELDSTRMIKAGTPVWLLLLISALLTGVGYLGFRRRCIDWLSETGPSMSKRAVQVSAAMLLLWLVIQSAIGLWLADRL